MNADDEREAGFAAGGERFRQLGYRLVDLMAEILDLESADPVLIPATGEEVRAALDAELPRQGTSIEAVLDEFRQGVLRYARRNGHPRFFAFVSASADPIGILADALASALNQNVTSWRSAHSATEVERLVLCWIDRLVGFDGGGSGLLLGGGSAANAHGLACAVAGARSRNPGATPESLTLYLSPEGHLSLRKAALSLGITPASIRIIETDAARRMRPDLLRHSIEEDIGRGASPACVCASAGTANTGAIDPLEEIADVCRRHDVWLHIDGAYGAPAAMTDEYAWLRGAFARADSLSLDPHKWLFAPIDVGCSLVRNGEMARRAFGLSSEYIEVTYDDPIERFAFFEHGPELSRRFRALKVWMILKYHGADAIAREIGRNIDLRRHLDRRIVASPRLEPMGSELSISCFRYLPEQPTREEALNELNREILETINREGRLHMSPTTLDGRYALRVCIVNFRTTTADIDLLVDEVLRIGTALT